MRTHSHLIVYSLLLLSPGPTAVRTEGKTVPVYATASVTKVIRDWDERKEQQWKPVFKEEWPPRRVFPDHELRSGQNVNEFMIALGADAVAAELARAPDGR
jgi:hypothetical protein